MHKILMAGVALIAMASVAQANTTLFQDTVTFVGASGSYPNCIMFQTTARGGVQGINNVSSANGGNTGATGYTGGAQWNVVGVGSGTGTRVNQAGLIAQMPTTSRLSNGNLPIDWVHQGNNGGGDTTICGDCNIATGFNAAEGFGQ
jgi:hypothetical protein